MVTRCDLQNNLIIYGKISKKKKGILPTTTEELYISLQTCIEESKIRSLVR